MVVFGPRLPREDVGDLLDGKFGRIDPKDKMGRQTRCCGAPVDRSNEQG